MIHLQPKKGKGIDHSLAGIMARKKRRHQVELLERTHELSKTTIAIMRYQNDDAYRYLHDRISELFAESLKSDLSLMESDEIKKLAMLPNFVLQLILHTIKQPSSVKT